MKYSEVIQNIINNLVSNFDEVYHSVEIVVTDDRKYPGYPIKDDYGDLSPTDQHEVVYVRRVGDDSVNEDMRTSGCTNGYKMQTPLRIVYFKDHATDHQQIIAKLLKAALLSNTKLRSITIDKWKLQKEESSGEYRFGAATAYFAIDILAFWYLMPSTCEDDCIEYNNPVKKDS